jgi:uncharacterized membrane protein YfcA
MDSLSQSQYLLIALVFIWSGFVRSGLGFGGAVLSLPILLLIDDRPQVYLPIISCHLLIFGSLAVWQGHRSQRSNDQESSVDWDYLKKSMLLMIVPKILGVLGLVTLPNHILSAIIFCIILVYSISYILNKPFRSQSPWMDRIFLIAGAYVSGTSLIGAPLIVAVYANHVRKEQLRDTLFALWVILVAIKMAGFIWAGIDLQIKHMLYLLPSVALGHWLGQRLHDYLQSQDPSLFFRYLGIALLAISLLGLYQTVL